MAGISSLGIGSGLDLGSLVKNLLEAKKTPLENSFNRQKARVVSDLSGIGLMKASLSTFRSSLSEFASADSFSTRTSSNSNTDALRVMVDNHADAGTYQIALKRLASSQSLASKVYSRVTESVGTGSIQIRFGTTGSGASNFRVNAEKPLQTITLDNRNNTLAGLKDHINAGHYGIRAGIIQTGEGYRLTLTAVDTGENHSLEISVQDDDANNHDTAGLSALAYNASATQLSEVQSAQDALLSVNGLEVSSASNHLDEVIEGVHLELLKTTTTDLTLTVTESTAQLNTAIRSMIDSYNDMAVSLNALAAVGSETAESGSLVGDASLRNFRNSLHRIMTSPVSGSKGAVTALSNIGISTQADGTLKIDEGRFDRAMQESPTAVLALFTSVGQSSDGLIKFQGSESHSAPGTYGVDITRIATQAMLSGVSGVRNLSVGSDNDALSVTIDGVGVSIQLTPGVYASATELAAEMQVQINSATAQMPGGKAVQVDYDRHKDRFILTSNTVGRDSSIEITAVDTNTQADFGLSVAVAVSGVDVAGTIGGISAVGSGRTLRAANGLSIEVAGGNIGSRGSLHFSRGFVESIDTLLDGYLNARLGTLAVRENGLNESLERIADERVALDLRLETLEASLVRQFTALDGLLAEFKNTGNFLTQQIQALPGSGTLLKKK